MPILWSQIAFIDWMHLEVSLWSRNKHRRIRRRRSPAFCCQTDIILSIMGSHRKAAGVSRSVALVSFYFIFLWWGGKCQHRENTKTLPQPGMEQAENESFLLINFSPSPYCLALTVRVPIILNVVVVIPNGPFWDSKIPIISIGNKKQVITYLIITYQFWLERVWHHSLSRMPLLHYIFT